MTMYQQNVSSAVNIVASSTRRDDLLLDKTLDVCGSLRKYLADMNPIEAMDFVKTVLKKQKTMTNS